MRRPDVLAAREGQPRPPAGRSTGLRNEYSWFTGATCIVILRRVSYTSARRDLIRDVLLSERVQSQEELLQRLEERGVPSTQPVLSRDLRALGAVKREGAYVLLERERVTPLETLQSLLRSADTAGPNLVVVRCEPGAASAVARALEAEGPAGMLGTVAGDDTIFVAVPARAAGQHVLRRVRELL